VTYFFWIFFLASSFFFPGFFLPLQEKVVKMMMSPILENYEFTAQRSKTVFGGGGGATGG